MIVKCGLLLTVAVNLMSIVAGSYQYLTNHNSYQYKYYPASSLNEYSYKSAHPYYSSRSPIFYIRPATRTRVVRPLTRAYVPITESPVTSTILLNDTEPVAFTKTNAALSTKEFEENPVVNEEEGVGPAVEFEENGSPSVVFRPLSSSSKILHILSKGSSEASEVKGKKNIKNKNKFKSPYEPEVVYSDVHPIYVKPPTNFKPVVYPNRRLDGVRATDKFSNNIPLIFASSSLPYDIPRGLSSWSLGGPKALTRGNYWESLGSDEALRLNGDSSSKVNARLSHRPYMPWLIFPSSTSPSSSQVSSSNSYSLPGGLIRYQIQYEPSVSSSVKEELPIKKNKKKASTASSKRVSTSSSRQSSSPSTSESRRVNSVPKLIKVAKSSPKAVTVKKISTASSSSSEGIRTKLPVGLTSWFLGGVRDLSGKHWKMPDLSVDNVAVVPLNPNSSTEDKTDTDDVMMTSDGDFERIPPVVVNPVENSPEREREENSSSSREESPVVFDDDPEFFSANNNVN